MKIKYAMDFSDTEIRVWHEKPDNPGNLNHLGFIKNIGITSAPNHGIVFNMSNGEVITINLQNVKMLDTVGSLIKARVSPDAPNKAFPTGISWDRSNAIPTWSQVYHQEQHRELKNFAKQLCEPYNWKFVRMVIKGREVTLARLYRNKLLVAIGRAICCAEDLKKELYDSKRGEEIALGRAKKAVRIRSSFGKTSVGFLGSYYG